MTEVLKWTDSVFADGDMSEQVNKKLLIIQAAALSRDFDNWTGPEFRSIEAVFPAVTCVAQASFRTASPPIQHGMIANGLYHRDLRKVMFWEQSAGLVSGKRIWSDFRARGRTVAMLFWQQSMGEDVDILLTPAPIHKHHGGMIQDCYCQPAGLYKSLCEKLGRPFKLRHYWGPLASAKVGDWITDATAEVISDPDLAPDLCFTYLPTLDYDFQRFGPDHKKSLKATEALARQLQSLLETAKRNGYEVLIFGDYAIAPATGEAILPNRALLEAGLMSVRDVRGMLYPDFHASKAFAVVDHEIAHVYVDSPGDIEQTKQVLAELPGVVEVLSRDAQQPLGLDHPNSGELVIVADEGNWFAYPWWLDKRQAPDYATHIDIHNKPGFDPCELFFGWPPMSVSLDTSRIRGSHGRVGPERQTRMATTLDLPSQPANIIELAQCVRNWLN